MYLVDQSNIFAKNCMLHKFATTNTIFVKSILLDMHHHKTYIYINCQQNRVNRSVITVHTNVFAKIASCINLQLSILIFKKSILLDINHHKTYMYINFQQNRVNRLIITMHPNVFAINCKLHKFATINSNF